MPKPMRSPTPASRALPPVHAVSTTKETMVPLAAFSHFEPGHTPLAVNHQGLFVASTISFNLRARRIAQRRGPGNPGGDEGAPRPGHDPRQHARNRPSIRRVFIE